jgi:superfamily I DNA/RNA helicase
MRLKILGPPGTGKTTKALEYIEGFYNDPAIGRIVFCSFTVKAKNEAKQRMEAAGLPIRSNKNPDARIELATIHSLAFNHMNYKRDFIVNTLAKFAKSIGQKSSIIHDRYTQGAKTPVEKAIAFYQILRSRMMQFDEVHQPEGMDRKMIDGYISEFEIWKDKAQKIDYNDVLFNYLRQGDPFPHDVAIVDEAQDLSPLQWACVNKMFNAAKHYYTVGDDDQAIFGFAGTRAADFINWPCDETKVLDHSYRLGATVQGYSEKVLDRMTIRLPKTFGPREGKSSVRFTDGIDPITDIFPYKSCAILARNAYVAEKAAMTLDTLGIMYTGKKSPFSVKGPMKAIRLWEAWRNGDQLFGKDLHAIFKFVPTNVRTVRYDDLGRKAMAPPCPHPTVPWQNILDFEGKTYYENVQSIQGLAYLLSDPIIEITTIHQSKGGQWDKVILFTDVSAATYKQYQRSSDEERDEEHRVWYVGLTRAKIDLQIIRPQTLQYYPLEEI